MNDHVLRAKLAKVMSYNYYREPAWLNDILYIFSLVILSTIACNVGFTVLESSMIGKNDMAFCNPFENFTEIIFLLIFQIFCMVSNKFLSVL